MVTEQERAECWIVQYRVRVNDRTPWGSWAVLNTPDNLTETSAKRICHKRREQETNRHWREWRVLHVTQEVVY